MLRLTATFKVSLASPLFINRPPRQEGVRTIPPLRYDTRIDDSDVEIALPTDDYCSLFGQSGAGCALPASEG
jgi:hypothetical protein